MFFGREKELEQLNNFYDDESSKIACVVGRSGIGKSSLVKDFLKNKPHTFFHAYATTGMQEVALFARVIGYNTELSNTFSPAENLNILLEHLVVEQDAEPYVLAIDNFPVFVKSESGFDTVLFDFIKKCEGRLKLIFCSDSYLQFSKVLFDKKSIWKNSIDLYMQLEGLGFYDAVNFMDGITDPIDQAFIYGVTGGIPTHLSKAVSDRKEFLSKIFFDGDLGNLLPERIIQSELRELSYYNHILMTLAEGHNRVNQISKCVDKPKDVVVPYMNTLMSIGIVTKENPVTEKTNRKKTRYSIINSFDVFWYRFFAPRIELAFEKNIDRLMSDSIEPNLDSFMESVFISMCRQYLEKKSTQEKMPFTIKEIGNWWQNDDEKQTTEGFDLVAVGESDNDESIIFARCYYTDEPVAIATLKELIDLTKRVRGKKNVFYLVFSKSGFHENTKTVAATIKNIILISLEDIVNG